MFILLLAVTFLVAASCAFAVARLFDRPIAGILARLVSDLGGAWHRYIKFAIFVVGISSGVRIHQLEMFIAPSSGETRAVQALTGERWALEIYRTVIETLQNLAWLLLVFYLFALVAFVIVRGFELRREKS